MNPPTVIQRPFANAVRASATTKIGKTDEIRTTRASAATRSRYSNATKLKKASAPGRRFMSQYVTIANKSEMKTMSVEEWTEVHKNGRPMMMLAIKKDVGP